LARAACLLATAAEILHTIGVPLPADYDQTLAAVRAAMGEEAFGVAWSQGKAMTLAQAVEFASHEAVLA
jgi:hypothetical protein